MNRSFAALLAAFATIVWLPAWVDASEGGAPHPGATFGVYEMVERTFTSSRTWSNGFLQVDVDFTFTHSADPAVTITLPAFWNGKDSSGHDRFTVRFAPTRAGDWTYRSRSAADKSLDGLSGPDGRSETIRATPSSKPGFIQRSDIFHWKYSNGQRFFPVGTTAYEWIGSPCADGPALRYAIDFVQAHFNKVRLSYMSTRLADNAFGGARKLSPKTENGFRWYSDLSEVDSRVLNLEHWKRLDRLIGSLHEAGVHVELILARKSPLGFQVQGNWIRGIGGRPGSEGLMGDKGIRYFVARYAAFPRLWWCIGNEWPEAGLTPHDIRRIGERIKQLDPYSHPLSAHWNEEWMFGGEAWPTHGILQTHLSNAKHAGLNQNIIDLRTRHGIGFVNAEYGYENRVRTPNTPENVVKAHWVIVLGGGHADYGHSPARLAGKYMWAGLDYYWGPNGNPAPAPASVADVAAGRGGRPVATYAGLDEFREGRLLADAAGERPDHRRREQPVLPRGAGRRVPGERGRGHGPGGFGGGGRGGFAGGAIRSDDGRDSAVREHAWRRGIRACRSRGKIRSAAHRFAAGGKDKDRRGRRSRYCSRGRRNIARRLCSCRHCIRGWRRPATMAFLWSGVRTARYISHCFANRSDFARSPASGDGRFLRGAGASKKTSVPCNRFSWPVRQH